MSLTDQQVIDEMRKVLIIKGLEKKINNSVSKWDKDRRILINRHLKGETTLEEHNSEFNRILGIHENEVGAWGQEIEQVESTRIKNNG